MREQRLTASSVHLALQGIHYYPRAWHRVGMKKAAEEQKEGPHPRAPDRTVPCSVASFMQGS